MLEIEKKIKIIRFDLNKDRKEFESDEFFHDDFLIEIINMYSREKITDSELKIPPSFSNGLSFFSKNKKYNDKIYGIIRNKEDVILLSPNTSLIIIPNGFEYLHCVVELIELIKNIREIFGFKVSIYISGIAIPSILSILVYFGLTIFDNMATNCYGLNNIRCLPEGQFAVNEDCDTHLLIKENDSELLKELEKIYFFSSKNMLRNLAESRSSSSILSHKFLKLIDKYGFNLLEEVSTITGKKLMCNTSQSLDRPEVKKYIEKINSNYKKPTTKKILLLLPCSYKKPYHTSKTHKILYNTIHGNGFNRSLHEVIITSPLGVVPRELDIFFPANCYNIPVYNIWTSDEKELIRNGVKKIINSGYEKIISHLDSKTYNMISDLGEIKNTCLDNKLLSTASLHQLETEINNCHLEKIDKNLDNLETVRSILTFQFNEKIADELLKNSTVKNKYPFYKVFNSKNEKLAELNIERQMMFLTLEGGKILFENNYNIIEVEKFKITGDIFAPGIKNAFNNIRIGDEVVIHSEGNVLATGVSKMCGRQMVDLNKGLAVKVRNHAKN